MKVVFPMFRAGAMALGLLVAAQTADAHETKKGDLTVIHAHARPNLPNRPTAAYMAISNDGETGDRLLAAQSDAFGTVEIHTTVKQGDVMKMMPVDVIDVPAGDTALLEPGGLHLMLFDGQEGFKIGDSFPMVLTFENAGEVLIEVKVEKIKAGHNHSGHSGHSGHDHSGHSGHSGHNHTN